MGLIADNDNCQADATRHISRRGMGKMLLKSLAISLIIACSHIATVPAAASHHSQSGSDSVEGELGVVHFENSGAPDAQASFIRGLLLLHSFEYTAARRSFLEAQKQDPHFALAVWGEALTYNHALWNEQDTPAARAALTKLGATSAERVARGATEREREYLGAVEKLYGAGDKLVRNRAYSDAMHDLARKFPDDLDARALYSLSLLGLTGLRNHENYMRAAAEAEAVYDVDKRHPGALHYMIHAYDDPIHAPLGLRAARLYAQVAPAAPHAVHMTSHIYFALGMWDEAIEANDASVRVARAQGDPNYHALLWLEYADLQKDKREQAAAAVRSVASDVADHPTKDSRLRLALARAIWLVETRGAIGVDAELPDDGAGIQSISYFSVHDYARGITAAEAGEFATARGALQLLRQRIQSARPRPANENAAWFDAMTPNELEESRILAEALEGTIAFHQGHHAQGIAQVRKAASTSTHIEFEYGPPWAAKPLDELLGELMLKDGRRQEAISAFQRVLTDYPNRRLAVEGLASANKLP
jgi:tetratricopeptide (TPR) repeat protein